MMLFEGHVNSTGGMSDAVPGGLDTSEKPNKWGGGQNEEEGRTNTVKSKIMLL